MCRVRRRIDATGSKRRVEERRFIDLLRFSFARYRVAAHLVVYLMNFSDRHWTSHSSPIALAFSDQFESLQSQA